MNLPKFMDLSELAYHISLSPDQIIEMVKAGELPGPEKRGCKVLWRWDQIDRALSDGAESCHLVYFIRLNDFIKIGFTRNVTQRFQAIEAAVPYDVTLLHEMPGSFDLELDLHRKFKHLRVRGEWFRADLELVNFIEELKNNP